MKKNTLTQHVLRFIVLSLISGCTSTFLTEEFPSPVPTYTILPKLTVTSTITPTLANATPTPIGTIAAEEQISLLREFMSHNGNCRLPCWWGISPGQTLDDAQKEIHRLRGISGELFLGYDPETTVYGIGGIPLIVDVTTVVHSDTVYFEEKQGFVYAWHITSTGGVEDPDEFRRIWKNYSAQSIIKAYGMPERILLRGNPSSNSVEYGLYSLWLFYDELGFSILYEARIPMDFSNASHFRICSETDPLLGIELNMQSPKNTLRLDRFDRTLEEVRLGTDIGKAIVIRSLQESAGLDDKEIHDVFFQSEEACFTIPSDIWRVN